MTAAPSTRLFPDHVSPVSPAVQRTSPYLLPVSDQPLSTSDQADTTGAEPATEPAVSQTCKLLSVLRKAMADPDNAREREELDRRLRDYLDQEEDDRRNGRTRERYESLVKNLSDQMSEMKTTFTARLAEHGTRLGRQEADNEKIEKRLDKLEDKIDGVREDSGLHNIEELQAKVRFRNKIFWTVLGGAVSVGVALLTAVILRAAGFEVTKAHEVPEMTAPVREVK